MLESYKFQPTCSAYPEIFTSAESSLNELERENIF